MAEGRMEINIEGEVGPDSMLGELNYETLVMLSIQELFQRVITLENMLTDVIGVVSDNTHSPALMAEELRAILEAPDDLTDELDGT